MEPDKNPLSIGPEPRTALELLKTGCRGIDANDRELSKEEALSKTAVLVHENGSLSVVVRGVYELALMQAPEIV